MEEVGFSALFVFAYSPRPGTTALRLVDDVPEGEKLRRLKVLNHRQQRLQADENARRVGSVEEVLVDTVGEGEQLSGRTRDFRIVHLQGPAEWLGRFLSVEITRSGPNALVGRPTSTPNVSLTEISAVPIF